MTENMTEMQGRDIFYALGIILICCAAGILYNPLFSTILCLLTIISAMLPDGLYGKCWIIVTFGGKSGIISRVKHAYQTKTAKIIYLAPIILSIVCIINLIYAINKLL